MPDPMPNSPETIRRLRDDHLAQAALLDRDLRTAEECLRIRPTLARVLTDVREEVERAESKWPALHSAHEALGVLMEEVRELTEHVDTHQHRRNLEDMRKEAIQVAAMAVRFVRDICDGSRGRN